LKEDLTELKLTTLATKSDRAVVLKKEKGLYVAQISSLTPDKKVVKRESLSSVSEIFLGNQPAEEITLYVSRGYFLPNSSITFLSKNGKEQIKINEAFKK